MGPDVVEVLTPVFDHDLRLLQRVEDFTIKQFIAQLAVDGEDGPAPDKGPYTGPTLQKGAFR